MTKQLERTTQTKDALIYAFWELYQTTPIEKITVKSITDRAGYYRSTFYCYFTDVYQVLEDIEQNILNELNYILIQMDPKEIYSDTLRAQLYFDTHNELFLNLMVQFYEKNSTYLLLLFSAKGDPSFVEKFKNTVRKYFFPDNALAELPPETFLIFEYTLSATLSLLTSYYQQNYPSLSLHDTLRLIQSLNETSTFVLLEYFNQR